MTPDTHASRAIRRDRTRIDYAIRELRAIETPTVQPRVRRALRELNAIDCGLVQADQQEAEASSA
jgi:hypothetical protein